LEEEQESRGWDIVDWLKTPPEGFTAFVYLLAVLLIAYLAYMIGLGLFAFTKLGHEITFGSVGTSAPAPAAGTGGSLTVFFTVLLALVGGPLAIWRVITAHVQAQAARRQADIATQLCSPRRSSCSAPRARSRRPSRSKKKASKSGSLSPTPSQTWK
jgi:hypothetical protein